MQVSWIDPEEVASLAESLRPAARPAPVARAPEPAVKQEPVEPLVEEPPVVEPVDGPAMPNLSAFRQRLQAIREKAINAGLLTPQAAPAAIPAPVPAPADAAQPTFEAPVAEAAPVPAIPAPTFAERPADTPSYSPVEAPPPIEYAPPVTDDRVFKKPEPRIPLNAGASVKDRLDAFTAWADSQWGPGDLLVVDEYGDLLLGPLKKSGLVLSTMMAWNAAIRASAQAASGISQVMQQTLATGETLTLIPCKTRLGLLQIALVKTQAPQDHEISELDAALAEVMDLPD